MGYQYAKPSGVPLRLIMSVQNRSKHYYGQPELGALVVSPYKGKLRLSSKLVLDWLEERRVPDNNNACLLGACALSFDIKRRLSVPIQLRSGSIIYLKPRAAFYYYLFSVFVLIRSQLDSRQCGH